MTTGRPRTATTQRAARGRTVADAELAPHAPLLALPTRTWLSETVTAFGVYGRSEAAKALRAEDYPEVVRLFDYRDVLVRMTQGWETPPADVKWWQSVKVAEAMALALAAHLGIGPAPRARLSISTMHNPGSELEAFNAEGNPRALREGRALGPTV